MKRQQVDMKRLMDKKRKDKVRKRASLIAASMILLTPTIAPPNVDAANPITAQQVMAESVYKAGVDYKWIKYGRLEVRDFNLNTNELFLKYSTHYILNIHSKLKNTSFNLTLDERLEDEIVDVQEIERKYEILRKRFSHVDRFRKAIALAVR